MLIFGIFSTFVPTEFVPPLPILKERPASVERDKSSSTNHSTPSPTAIMPNVLFHLYKAKLVLEKIFNFL